jgi:hypothetical protein
VHVLDELEHAPGVAHRENTERKNNLLADFILDPVVESRCDIGVGLVGLMLGHKGRHRLMERRSEVAGCELRSCELPEALTADAMQTDEQVSNNAIQVRYRSKEQARKSERQSLKKALALLVG